MIGRIIEKDRFSREIDIENSPFNKMEFSTLPLHYKDSNGNLSIIDTNFDSKSDRFENINNTIKTIIFADAQKEFNLVQETEDGNKIKFDLREMLFINDSDKELISEVQSSNNYHLNNNDDGDLVIQSNTFPDVVDEYQVLESRLKHNIYLHSLPQPSIDTTNLKLRFEYIVEVNGLEEVISENEIKSTDFKTKSPIKIKTIGTDTDNIILHCPVAEDDEGEIVDVYYNLEFIDSNTFKLSYEINYNDLLDKTFPICIDPTVSISDPGGFNTITKTFPLNYEQPLKFDGTVSGHSSTGSTGVGSFAVKDGTGTERISRGSSSEQDGKMSVSGWIHIKSGELGTGELIVEISGDDYSSDADYASASVTYFDSQPNPDKDYIEFYYSGESGTASNTRTFDVGMESTLWWSSTHDNSHNYDEAASANFRIYDGTDTKIVDAGWYGSYHGGSLSYKDYRGEVVISNSQTGTFEAKIVVVGDSGWGSGATGRIWFLPSPIAQGKLKLYDGTQNIEIGYYNLSDLNDNFLRIDTPDGIKGLWITSTDNNLASPIRINTQNGIKSIVSLN